MWDVQLTCLHAWAVNAVKHSPRPPVVNAARSAWVTFWLLFEWLCTVALWMIVAALHNDKYSWTLNFTFCHVKTTDWKYFIKFFSNQPFNDMRSKLNFEVSMQNVCECFSLARKGNLVRVYGKTERILNGNLLKAAKDLRLPQRFALYTIVLLLYSEYS